MTIQEKDHFKFEESVVIPPEVISFNNRRNSLTQRKEPTKKLEPILPKGVINIVHRPKIITENVNSKLQ